MINTDRQPHRHRQTYTDRQCINQSMYTSALHCTALCDTGGICRGGGKPGNFPSLDLTFPPTGLSENLGGMERGRGGKGKDGGDHLPYFPPTGLCLKYHRVCDMVLQWVAVVEYTNMNTAAWHSQHEIIVISQTLRLCTVYTSYQTHYSTVLYSPTDVYVHCTHVNVHCDTLYNSTVYTQ